MYRKRSAESVNQCPWEAYVSVRKAINLHLRNLAIAKKSVSLVPIGSHNPHSRFAATVVVVVGDLVLHHNSNNDTDNRQKNKSNEEADPSLFPGSTSRRYGFVSILQPEE